MKTWKKRPQKLLIISPKSAQISYYVPKKWLPVRLLDNDFGFNTRLTYVKVHFSVNAGSWKYCNTPSEINSTLCVGFGATIVAQRIHTGPSEPRECRGIWDFGRNKKSQRSYQRWLDKIIYKTEMKFWAVLGSRGCREKKLPNAMSTQWSNG
jgi:hypothetical protein